MMAGQALSAAQNYTRSALLTYLVFVIVSLAFAALTVLSPDIYETEAYADKRKVMSICYTLVAVTMLLIVLHLTARSNASLALGRALAAKDAGADTASGVFRGLSTLWGLFFMAAPIITVNYIVLIYAVEGGLF